MINKSNISELSVEDGDFKITIKQEQTQNAPVIVQTPVTMPIAAPQPVIAPPAAAPAIAAPQPAPSSGQEKGMAIKSPMIGTFYRSPAPDKPAFVNVGDEIKKGDVLCIIEAMKLFNEIESEVDGRIIKVLVDEATPVEYDQPLFLVEPN